MGVAKGHIDLDFASMKQSVSSAVQELKKLERQDSLVDSELNKLRQTAALTGQAMDEQAEQVKLLSSQLQNAKTRADTYKKGMEDMKSAMERASQEQKNLTAKVQENLEAQKQAEDRLKTLTPAYQDAQKAIKAAADEYGAESEECQKAAQEHEKAIKAYEDTAKKADELQNQLVQLEGKQKLANTAVQQAGDQLEEYQIALNNTETDIASLTVELKTAENKAVSFGDALQNAGGKMSAAADKAGSIGTKLTLGVTAPIIGIGTAAVNAGNDFEAQMSRVSAIAGAYGDDLEKLREQAIELGAQTSFSATESAQAMENLASAGFGTQEIMAAMPGMLDLAASSGEDLASSADIAASTLRGFQLEASEAGHVADVLAKNAADTNAAIMDTGYAMKYIAPVAQSAGWSLEEVTAAIGVMADSGIKGEQAGTTLRGALTRLMKPTDAMADSMEALGIAFYDSQGKMKPLSTIVDELQKSTKGLTDEQRDYHLATIFGTEALSGMKILLASSKEELDTMTDGLKNADGAAKKMADTMLDNTKGSVEEMNGSLETAGITIQKQLAPWITKGAKKVTELANEFSELDENTQGTILTMGGIAAASGPVIKGLSGVTGGIGKLVKGTGGLIQDLGKISSAKKAAEALGAVGDFSAKSVDGVSGLSKVLFNLGSPAGIAVMAAGAAAALGIGIQALSEDVKRANLEEHFGDITLSAEETQDIAERLTTNEWTMKIDAVIDAKEKLSQFEADIQSSVDTMNQIGWMVEVGIDLSEDEKKSFQSAAKEFITSTTSYLKQQQYTISLAIDTIITPGTEVNENISKFTTEFYSKTYSEVEKLGKEYADVVDKAFADNILTEDEYLNIETIRQRMQALTDKAASYEYTGTLKALELQADQSNISVESFQQLQKDIEASLQERMDHAEEAFSLAIGQVELAFDEGAISQKEREEFIDQLTIGFNRDKSEIVLQGLGVQVRTIQANYSDAVGLFSEEFSNSVNEAINNQINASKDNRRWDRLWNELEGSLYNMDDKIEAASPGTQRAIRDLLSAMQPTTKELEKIAQSFYDAGMIPPKNVSEGLLDVYELEVMSGNTEHMYEILASEIANSPKAQEAVREAVKSGNDIPEELATALKNNYGLVYDAQSGMFDEIGKAVPTKAEEIKNLLSAVGIDIPNRLAESIAKQGGSIETETLNLLSNIQTGVSLKQDELFSVFTNLGISLPESLISSLSGQNANVQQQAIELFSQIQYADDEKRPELLEQMLELGKNVDENLCSGIADNLVLVKDEATGMISVLDSTTGTEVARITPEFAKKLKKMGSTGFDSMDEAMKSGKLTAPEVDDMDTKPVEDWRSDSQQYLNQHPLSASIKAGALAGAEFLSSIAKNANGGIIERQTLSWLAEGDQPEAVIPLSSSKRSRGIELWQQAGEALGVMDAARDTMAAQVQSTRGGSNPRQFAAALAAQLRKMPIEVTPQFHVSAGDIYLDREQVGRSLSPVIDTELSQIQGIRRRGG